MILIRKKKIDEVAEIGCGNGANAKYLSNFYNKYTGFDFSKQLIDIAIERYGNNSVKFFQADLMELDENKKYDIIVGIGILHHLPDLNKYLKKIKKIGNKETLYIFLEPQGENPLIQLLRYIRKKIDSTYSKSQVFFKIRELEKHFTESGLEIIKYKQTGYFASPFALVMMKPSWLFLPIIKLLIIIDSFIQNKFPNRFSWNISFVARIKSDK